MTGKRAFWELFFREKSQKGIEKGQKMMKLKYTQRLLGGICACVLLMNTMLQPVCAAEIAGVTSPVYVVMDANSGEILYSKNENQSVYPASTAKLVTAMVVLDAADKDKEITITSNMLGTFSSDVATIGLKEGGTYTVHELLQLLLVSSAADAAEALAVGCFGSTEKCLEKMNEKVQSLGLTNTHFDNTVGLDIGNNYTKTYTTAAEFAELSRLAMTYEEIRAVVSIVNYTLPARTNNDSITRNTTNLLLRDYYDYPKELYTIIGTKTGITQAAGRTLVATATDGIHEVICVTFSNPNADVMYTSAQKAFYYVFTQNEQNIINLAEAGPGQTVVSTTEQKPGQTVTSTAEQKPGQTAANGEKEGVGWTQLADGNWCYYLEDGSRQTGWLINDSYEWYYFDASGIMLTGWVKWGSQWYYMGDSGKMVVSTTTPDGYMVGPDGAWIPE